MDFKTLTPQQVLALGKPLPEFQKFLESKATTQMDWSDPDQALTILRNYMSLEEQSDQPDPEVVEESHHFTSRDGVSLPLRTFKTTEGGFVIGSPVLMAGLARVLAKEYNAVVVTPTYRLAPEHPFPTGYNDGWDAFTWIAENACTVLGANPSKGFIVGGISSGANIANTVAHLARDHATQPPLTGVWLSCGGIRLAPKYADLLPTEYKERLLSRTQDECLNGGVSSPGLSKLFRDLCQEDPDSKLFAPLIWSPGPGYGHSGLPKIYQQVCGMDTPRDEALIFDDMLKGEGVETRLDLYSGLPHVFWHSYKELPQSKAWIEDTSKGFDWLLDTGDASNRF